MISPFGSRASVQFENVHMRLLRDACKRSAIPVKRCSEWKAETMLDEGRVIFLSEVTSGAALTCASVEEVVKFMQRRATVGGTQMSLKRSRPGVGSRVLAAEDSFWEEWGGDAHAAEPDEASLKLVKNLMEGRNPSMRDDFCGPSIAFTWTDCALAATLLCPCFGPHNFDNHSTEQRQILPPDSGAGNWVRRSERASGQFESQHLKTLLDQITSNHKDAVVLKLKHHIGPDSNTFVIDSVLRALMRNDNCEALYIQNLNDGMLDPQLATLAKVLRRGNIWCLNIGENYRISAKAWEQFANALVHTNVTHMYASEHVISAEQKTKFRDVIRENRKKHSRHNSIENLHVIERCTNMWWNPIQSKQIVEVGIAALLSIHRVFCLIKCMPVGARRCEHERPGEHTQATRTHPRRAPPRPRPGTMLRGSPVLAAACYTANRGAANSVLSLRGCLQGPPEMKKRTAKRRASECGFAFDQQVRVWREQCAEMCKMIG